MAEPGHDKYADFLRWKSAVCGEELDALERGVVLQDLPPIPKKRPRPRAFSMPKTRTSSGSCNTIPKPPPPPPRHASISHVKDFGKVPPTLAPLACSKDPALNNLAWLPTPPPVPVLPDRAEATVDIAVGAVKAEAMHALQEDTSEQQGVKTEQLCYYDDSQQQQENHDDACQQVEKKAKLELCESESPLAADASDGYETWPEDFHQ